MSRSGFRKSGVLGFSSDSSLTTNAFGALEPTDGDLRSQEFLAETRRKAVVRAKLRGRKPRKRPPRTATENATRSAARALGLAAADAQQPKTSLWKRYRRKPSVEVQALSKGNVQERYARLTREGGRYAVVDQDRTMPRFAKFTVIREGDRVSVLRTDAPRSVPTSTADENPVMVLNEDLKAPQRELREKPPRLSELELLVRQPCRLQPDVDDEIGSVALTQPMRRVAMLRREGNGRWRSEWEAIAGRVFEASRRALRVLSDLGVTDVDLNDGHVAEVTLTAEALVSHSSELVRRAPQLRHIHLVGYKRLANKVLSLELLRSIASLGLKGNDLDDTDLIPLVDCPFLTRLTWLGLRDNDITDRGLECLSKTRYLTRLVYIGLKGNPCTNPLDSPVEDGGMFSGTRPNEFGARLENQSPRKHLLWVHATGNFGPLFPPTPSDADALAGQLFQTSPVI